MLNGDRQKLTAEDWFELFFAGPTAPTPSPAILPKSLRVAADPCGLLDIAAFAEHRASRFSTSHAVMGRRALPH